MKHPVDKDDIDLFRETVGDVKPITQNRILLSNTKSKKRINYSSQPSYVSYHDRYDMALSERASVIGPNDVLLFKSNGIQDRIFNRLKKGQVPVIAELDLHGHTIYQAKLTLDRFIRQIQIKHTPGCVRIIHGKGYGSQHATPILKQYISGWLQQNSQILAYCSCPAWDGGTGAIYVLIKRI